MTNNNRASIYVNQRRRRNRRRHRWSHQRRRNRMELAGRVLLIFGLWCVLALVFLALVRH